MQPTPLKDPFESNMIEVPLVPWTSAPSARFPRNNNLEWLRVLFALQVVIGHCHAHLGLPLPLLLRHFPGVPAFFFVSGFLIYASHQNAGGLRYFQNRFLRLFPALLFVTLGGLVVVALSKGMNFVAGNSGTIFAWFIAQITLGQAYNPSIFRDIGVGVINGSLWTITTEILFYIMVPVIVWLERYNRHSVAILTLLSFVFYAFGSLLMEGTILAGQPLWRYFWITPLVWGWMFGFGMLAFKHYRLIASRMHFLPLVLAPMLVLILVNAGGPWLNTIGQELGIAYFVCYAMLIFYLAFGTPYLPLPFDLSYGIYIWHMPIINLLIVKGLPYPWIAMLATVALAAFSWFAIEKPALRLKRKTIHNLSG
ncbi:acyltransferase [Sphingopyxis granuli]|uniref:acyltransferase family protein n=1 Tax=Sphingopyxis granuli TaxID=267128 RepID=UPI001F53BC2F|nr:acyltransferase [Sphingopyxis granuli]UNK78553.1 acyltransferase [Sphingopyxis granuli]